MLLGLHSVTAQNKISDATYNHWLRSARQDIELLNNKVESQKRELRLTVQGWDAAKEELEKEKLFRKELQALGNETRNSLIDCRKTVDLLGNEIKTLKVLHDKELTKQKRRANWGKLGAFFGGAGLGFVAGVIYSVVR